jgi:hypothetical protein
MAELNDFELTDQEAKKRIYRFQKTKITVMTVADRKGADQLAPWIQRVYDRYQNQIDIDGVADVSMIPKLFQPILREAFKKRLEYSVMLDWDGSVVKQFAYHAARTKSGASAISVLGQWLRDRGRLEKIDLEGAPRRRAGCGKPRFGRSLTLPDLRRHFVPGYYQPSFRTKAERHDNGNMAVINR